MFLTPLLYSLFRKVNALSISMGGEWITKADSEHGPIRIVFPQAKSGKWVSQLIELQIVE